MPYVTFPQKKHEVQMSIYDLFSDNFEQKTREFDPTGTHTIFINKDHISFEDMKSNDTSWKIYYLRNFNTRTKGLDTSKAAYRTFMIPKRSGGLREICEPNEELKDAQRSLKKALESFMKATYHTSAFAYIENRSILHAVKRHQQNESQWFLHTDFSNFFGNTNMEFTMRMLSMIWPFNQIMNNDQGKEELEKAIRICFLNDALPQGTPISPMLTNIIMIPFDHYVANKLRDKGYVYTRYADDCTISSKFKFNPQEVINIMKEGIKTFGMPYTLKDEKTHFGSRAGRNWMLGLMLNKNNDITIGYRKKKIFKAMLANYVRDFNNGNHWSLNDVQVLGGLISYYKSIEPAYIKYLIEHYNSKFNSNIKKMIEQDIKRYTLQ